MRGSAIALAAILSCVVYAAIGPWAYATPSPSQPPPANCVWDPSHTVCIVEVGTPGSPGTTAPVASTTCAEAGQTIPCETEAGGWDDARHCYVKEAAPQPPLTDPVWGGRKPDAYYRAYVCTALNGARSMFVEARGLCPVSICLRPVTPEQLAQQAMASIVLPKPSGRRSPSETQLHNGSPFTWVNLWTYFWTDPNTWQPQSATASLVGMSATVTATPTQLIFEPGDGSAVVTCNGPGRPWSEADGNAAPSGTACGYQYRNVTDRLITATQSIVWRVTWTASTGATGELADVRTSTSGQLRVMQIQVVNR